MVSTYREFEKWYKQVRCNAFVLIQITNVPLDILAQASSFEQSAIIEESASSKSKPIIKRIHIEFTDETEIRNRGTNLLVAIELLHKLSI